MTSTEPPPGYSPKTAFIVGGVFLACTVSIILITALARKAKKGEEQEAEEVLQEGKGREPDAEQERELLDTMARVCKEFLSIMGEVASLGTACTVIGLNFILLGFFQMNFYTTFIVVVSVICGYGCLIVGHFNVMLSNCGGQIERMVGDGDGDVEMNDRYEDFGADLLGTILIGCVQVAYLISKGVIKRQAEANFFWVKMLIDNKKDTRYEWVKHGSNKLSKYSILMRMTLSYATNFVGLLIIMAFLPLQLSGSLKPFDFVLNSVAAYFIIEFDDVEAKTIKRLPCSDEELQLIPTESNVDSNEESTSIDDIEAPELNDQDQTSKSNQGTNALES